MGKESNKSQQKLNERIKELNCLYRLSRLMENQDIPEDEFFQSAVNLTPPAWQYPGITCARIAFNDLEYKTKGFRETQWKLSANIVVNNKTKGRLDVFYLEEMPEMDGYEAARKIREFNQKVPIIFQTAYAMAGDRQKALEAGCDDYASKPIKKKDLMEKINNLLKRD